MKHLILNVEKIYLYKKADVPASVLYNAMKKAIEYQIDYTIGVYSDSLDDITNKRQAELRKQFREGNFKLSGGTSTNKHKQLDFFNLMDRDYMIGMVVDTLEGWLKHIEEYKYNANTLIGIYENYLRNAFSNDYYDAFYTFGAFLREERGLPPFESDDYIATEFYDEEIYDEVERIDVIGKVFQTRPNFNKTLRILDEYIAKKNSKLLIIEDDEIDNKITNFLNDNEGTLVEFI